jgi:hypothetical protein
MSKTATTQETIMSTAQRIGELIVHRTRKGNNPIQSADLLADLLERHTGNNLAAALVYNGFATEKDAQRFVGAMEPVKTPQ